MDKGKNTCKILKEIRRQIAEANDIEFITSECRYQGDCLGTCPKCEAEVRYLEQQLEKKRLAGKAATIIGVSMGITSLIITPAAGQTTDTQTLVKSYAKASQSTVKPFTIKGKIIGASYKKNIANARIIEKGTENETLTDEKGDFKLKVSGKHPVLISHTDYESKEVAPDNLRNSHRILFTLNERFVICGEDISDEEAAVQFKILVKGHITNSKGEPLYKAEFWVNKEKRPRNISDLNGEFTVRVPENASLSISHIGYKTQTIKVKKKPLSNLHIVLQEEPIVLKEITLVKNGKEKEKDIAPIATEENQYTKPASFKFYDEGLEAYIHYRVVPPSGLDEKIKEIKLAVGFTVNTKGHLEDVELIQKSHTEFDDQIVKLLKHMPSWEPTKQRGVNVPVRYILPICLKYPQFKKEDIVYQVTEKMPSFPGGEAECAKFIKEQIGPIEASNIPLGRVIMQFIVERDGSLTNLYIARELDVFLDGEAIKIVKAMPKWIPGMRNGETVRTKYTLPINFRWL